MVETIEEYEAAEETNGQLCKWTPNAPPSQLSHFRIVQRSVGHRYV